MERKNPSQTEEANRTFLPKDGVSRFNQIEPFLPFSRETWRKLVRAKRAPQPISITSRCTVYSNAEMHRWFADPTNYKAAEE